MILSSEAMQRVSPVFSTDEISKPKIYACIVEEVWQFLTGLQDTFRGRLDLVRLGMVRSADGQCSTEPLTRLEQRRRAQSFRAEDGYEQPTSRNTPK